MDQWYDRFNAAAEKLAQDAARLESELEAAQVRRQGARQRQQWWCDGDGRCTCVRSSRTRQGLDAPNTAQLCDPECVSWVSLNWLISLEVCCGKRRDAHLLKT